MEVNIIKWLRFISDLLLQSFIQYENIIWQEFNYLSILKKKKNTSSWCTNKI